MCVAAVNFTVATALSAQPIVDTRHQQYTYEEMLQDLQQISERYGHCVRYEIGDTTSGGRLLPIVYFGDTAATRYVLVQACMHAREYASSQLVMTMLEQYASTYETDTYKGDSLKSLFGQVALVILPMMNPDGVEIAQHGTKGKLSADVIAWVNKNTKAGNAHTQIKANARGVDINRNFGNGFNKARKRSFEPSYQFYAGPKPYSEVEARLIRRISDEIPFTCFLNYHTCGNVVYYGCMNAESRVNQAAQRMANLIKRHTAYRLFGPETEPAGGTWADEVEVLYQKPSATIEIGTRNPVPVTELPRIISKNRWIWADLARAIIQNEI